MEASRARSPTLGSIAKALLAYVAEEFRADLRSEDSAEAVELYFGPVGCQPLPSSSIVPGNLLHRRVLHA